jgi:hypothetical protein
MRFYGEQRRFYCGIDLHASKMYVCVLDEQGNVVLHRNLRTEPEALKRALAPYRASLVVGAECMFSWYWVADWCRQEGIEFVLGHALYMKAIHGGKAKNDRIDSEKIARLLRGGTFPLAHVYPKETRGTRDFGAETCSSAGVPNCSPTCRTRSRSTTSRRPAARDGTGSGRETWEPLSRTRACR